MSDTPQLPQNANHRQDDRPERGERDNGDSQRSWETFDWSAWGVEDDAGTDEGRGQDERRPERDAAGEDTMRGQRGLPRGARPGMLRPALDDLGDDDDSPESAADGGRWITR